MKTINSPPKHRLKASVGIDSVFLQFKDVFKSDVDQFCRDTGFAYKGDEKGKYTRKWTIFLAGGQPITVVYHFKSKTTTFQIGKLMNYSRNLEDPHHFAQQIMRYYSDKPLQISGLHFSVDVKESINSLLVKSNLKKSTEKHIGSTVYLNGDNGTVLIVYDKGVQLQIYSTNLTRFELRVEVKMGSWKVKDFTGNRKSLNKLAGKIEAYFTKDINIRALPGKTHLVLEMGDTVKTLENFVAFLHGGSLPEVKDHFKVYHALRAKNTFFEWMRKNGIKKPQEISQFVKGHKAHCLQDIRLDHKTFNKAVNFYKGIPNFKLSA